MWFIMEESTERTLATTKFEDVANMIATAMPVKCVVRFNEWEGAHNNFFAQGLETQASA